MKIKTKKLSYNEVLHLPRKAHKLPIYPSKFLSSIIRTVTASDLKSVNFNWVESGIEELDNTPCLILMNHSSFIDLEIAAKIFKNRPYNIVCTSDGFVGKEWIMRHIGCIPTQKFVRDITLINDIDYCLKTLKCSVLMYPEASYSFDGCATTLPRKLGVLLKKLNVPVIGVKTFGAFTRDPLYNCLQKRKVDVTAEVSCIANIDIISKKSVKELDSLIDDFFTFDSFKWQQDNRIEITESFRADGLNRILYKCPNCNSEDHMYAKGTTITCTSCNAEYFLNKYGNLEYSSNINGFSHIPVWYSWERHQLIDDILNNKYMLSIDVDIGVMIDFKSIYMVGSGKLVHNINGFHLTGYDNNIDYYQSALSCYSLYSDFYWYEINDVICIGNNDILYYCFPKNKRNIVAKTRIASEEIYKIAKKNKRKNLNQTQKS